MARIVVTGGSGKAGRAVVRDLLEHGDDVLSIDLVRHPDVQASQLVVDLTELGETLEALHGADAVVHLAAIPSSGLHTEEVTFRTNMTSTFNVFSAGQMLGLKRVVWASSETILGLPFERQQPAYVPMDEEHPPLPQSSYALAKLLSEQMAEHFNRWNGIPHIGLRFSNIMEPHDYEQFPSWWDDPQKRKWNLWGYVDARDVAQSCRLAVHGELTGAETFGITAADTVMNRPSRELMAAVYPDVPVRELGEHETLHSIAKARRLLGFEPQHSWRDVV